MKHKVFTLLLLTAVTYTNVFPQLAINRQVVAGGSNDDVLNTICLSKHGGFMLAGNSMSNHSGNKTEDSRGYNDYWVIKYSRKGKQWDKTIGGDGDDGLRTAMSTHDGGYILGGWSNSGISGEKTENSKGGFDYWLVKLNGKGNIQWDKTIGSQSNDNLFALDQTRDGGYILYGNLGLTKIDSLGKILWRKTLSDDIDLAYAGSIEQTRDGGYILTGRPKSNPGIYVMIKTDKRGNIQWSSKALNTQLTFYFGARQTKDGGFVAYGYGATYIEYDYYIFIFEL